MTPVSFVIREVSNIKIRTRAPQEVPQVGSYADFAKLRVGNTKLDDAAINLGSLSKVNRDLSDITNIQRAISARDSAYLRDVSEFFYEVSGIYGRLVRYLAYLYRYDWMVVPYVNGKELDSDSILESFGKVLKHLDASNLKEMLGDIALKVIKNGSYYGYRIDTPRKSIMQELPLQYSRSRFFVGGKPLVEFNVKFFDEQFRDINQRMNVLKSFPKEFSKGYVAYKEGRLPVETGDQPGWIVLDSEYAYKFNTHGSDMPPLISVIPAIVDLDEAKGIDKKKMLQELLKIVIQKMPLDKNGDMIFDIDEAKEFHNNAVQMLGRAIGVDVLTTFAEIEVANMSDKQSATSKDDLQKVERGVYNEAGISQMLFATDGNLALDKSISNDEAAMYGLLLQFENFINEIVETNFNSDKLEFKVDMLTTTIYNYKEMSKMYKDQAMLGYSKFLSQIALGQSQSSILASAHFENEILNLSQLMVPLQNSNTMNSAEILNKDKKSDNPEGGRPEKPDDEKSDKTIQNKESMA